MPQCECGCGEEVRKRFVPGHNRARLGTGEPLEARYDVIDCGYETPCWVWQRTRSKKGYARIWSPEHGRVIQASRYFYERFSGPIPTGQQLDHLCRNTPCVNPEHLEPVSQFVNQQRGANAKLTREQADEIRRRGLVGAEGRRQGRRSGESLSALAREFGVSFPVVSGIVNGHLWSA